MKTTLPSIVTLNRGTLQQLARIRLRDARTLLDSGCYDGAYYLAGYAVECALKACIARKTRRYDFPDRRVVNDSYTHDLAKLVNAAGLELKLRRQRKRHPTFEQNWAVVEDWTEESRYQTTGRKKARDLYSAITSPQHGVVQWLKGQW